MPDLNLFDLNKPVDLYRILQNVYRNYIKNPTEKDFFFLTLGLTHLREWIAEKSWRDVDKKKKSGQPMTEGERFLMEIYDLSEFKVIQNLCNKGKHFIETPHETSKASGLRVGIGKVGDSLNQNYFLINGKDSRDYFIALFHKYDEWFSNHDYQD
ncbi:MAG: hypothetical protein R3B95_16210 [Nitrospirales bacterium]|nr:hypothetical protein [Nitrospirales bacterium]